MCFKCILAGEQEPNATKESNFYLAHYMRQAKSYLVPNQGHGWLAKDPELHIQMVRAWVSDKTLPLQLIESR